MNVVEQNMPLINSIISNAEERIETATGARVRLFIELPTPVTGSIDMDWLIQQSTKAWQVNPGYLTKMCRESERVAMRQIIYYIAKQLYPKTKLGVISSYFNQDHTTGLYAIKIAKERIKSQDNIFINLYNKVTYLLNEKV